MESKILPIFSVPICLTKLDDFGPLNEKLAKLFLAKEREGDKFKNIGALVYQGCELFESRFDLFDWPNIEIKELEKKIWSVLYGFIAKLNGYDNETLSNIHIKTESWFHIMRKNSYFSTHCHPMASWSGVYCVCPGEKVDLKSGKLEFINPFPAASVYVDVANAKLGGQFETSHVGIQFEPGQLVIFPSWLQHQVLPYFGNNERITVAFNARFVFSGQNLDLRRY